MHVVDPTCVLTTLDVCAQSPYVDSAVSAEQQQQFKNEKKQKQAGEWTESHVLCERK